MTKKPDWYDVDDLAAQLLNLGEGNDSDAVEQGLCDRFEISSEQFYDIVTALLPFTAVQKSPLTGALYQGFVNAREGYFIVRVEAE